MAVYNETIIVSAFNKISHWYLPWKEPVTGNLFRLVNDVPEKLEIENMPDVYFRPFGISIFKDFLFVINEGG